MRRALIAAATAGIVFLTGVPAWAAYGAADLIMSKGGAAVGDDYFSTASIDFLPSVLMARIKRMKTFQICVENQSTIPPTTGNFFVQGEGDQKGWRATWYDPNGDKVSDQDMENGDSPVENLSDDQEACWDLKIKRTKDSTRRAVWHPIARQDGLVKVEGDHGLLKIKRKN